MQNVTWNHKEYVLLRVEAGGLGVANEVKDCPYPTNLNASNCLSVEWIRPLWPAYSADRQTATLLCQRYGDDAVIYVPTIAEALQKPITEVPASTSWPVLPRPDNKTFAQKNIDTFRAKYAAYGFRSN